MHVTVSCGAQPPSPEPTSRRFRSGRSRDHAEPEYRQSNDGGLVCDIVQHFHRGQGFNYSAEKSLFFTSRLPYPQEM